jgi:hypothetical protein
MTQTINALFDEFDHARMAVEDLVNAGYSRENISMMANDVTGDHARRVSSPSDVKPGEGAGFGAVVGTLVGLGAALIPGIGPVIAAGPAWAALFAGIGAATGAVTGGITAALVDLGISPEEAGYYAEAVRRGGTLVSVQVEDEDAQRVRSLFNHHNPVDIQQRAAAYRESGWSNYTAEAAPHTSEQVEEERARHSPTYKSHTK